MPLGLTHIVMFSGGVGSWAAARRVAEKCGTKNLLLCFADTLIEDPDLYRFLDQAAADIGGQLVHLVEGRTPWQVFRDVRFLGNTRVDPCSRVLKREIIRKWLDAEHDPESTTIYLGIDWTEDHRFERAKKYWHPWHIEAPLCERPLVTKKKLFQAMSDAGIEQPLLYRLGFPHNNCGGFCIKAGHTHFAHLLDKLPERFAEHEGEEQALRGYLAKDVAILRDRRNGKTKPLTLAALRDRLTTSEQCDLFDWGGCGCFSP